MSKMKGMECSIIALPICCTLNLTLKHEYAFKATTKHVSLYCLLLAYAIKTPQKSQINLTATTYITYKIEKGGRGAN